jgi:2-polyprenyl-6-methoxyphenol hydroxylase-like FAD-dependent oxidoreductase
MTASAMTAGTRSGTAALRPAGGEGGEVETIRTQCCVAGGGPAGMMLGFLLARAGIDVVVLEKHEDFLRDFRGDTVHPSTLELMYELGLLDEFLKRPHQEVVQLLGIVGGATVPIANFAHIPTHCKFIALMPQWEFLNFLAESGRRYPAFRVLMRAEVTDLIDAGDRIAGVRATTPDGPVEIRADLVVGADGRHSTVRRLAGLHVDDVGAPIDVLWMRLPKRPGDPVGAALGRFNAGKILVTLDRGDYWQCASVIPKGGYDALRARGLQALRDDVGAVAPDLADRTGTLQSWDDVKLLTVTVDRLREWYRPGLLCIGDAAHAMSPVGGVGINLAIQDAVAAANLLFQPLRTGAPAVRDLAAVQQRRMLAVRLTQALQVFVQNRVLSSVLASTAPTTVPWPLKMLGALPFLRRVPARMVGLGFRPEHVRTPEVVTPATA